MHVDLPRGSRWEGREIPAGSSRRREPISAVARNPGERGRDRDQRNDTPCRPVPNGRLLRLSGNQGHLSKAELYRSLGRCAPVAWKYASQNCLIASNLSVASPPVGEAPAPTTHTSTPRKSGTRPADRSWLMIWSMRCRQVLACKVIPFGLLDHVRENDEQLVV